MVEYPRDLVEKWPQKPSMCAQAGRWRSASSGRAPRVQSVRITLRTWSVIQARQLGGESDGPVQGAGRVLGSFAGVLGDEGRYGLRGRLLTAVEVGGADRADDERVRPSVDLHSVDAGCGGSRTDGVGQQLGGGEGAG